MPGESILIVEDNETNLRLFTFLLTSKGYQVHGVADAQAAEHFLQNSTPRLILMDLQLPGTDGYQLTRTLKANPALRGVPIVALTAYAMRGDREKALEAGCDGYITKPIDTHTFPAKIAGFLAGTTGHDD